MLPRAVPLAVISLAALACGSIDAEGGGDVVTGCDPAAPATRTVSCVASFAPGKGAGFGQEDLPGIVYGEPRGAGLDEGGLDVVSLGKAGTIVVGFGGGVIVDGPGADFIVFENAFYAGGDASKPFVDLGEVSVSDDGVAWTAFPCATDAPPHVGCAGWSPVLASVDTGVSAFDPAVSGGEAFDLADLGLASARLVRIRDLGQIAVAPTAGFDLDAVAIVNAAP